MTDQYRFVAAIKVLLWLFLSGMAWAEAKARDSQADHLIKRALAAFEAAPIFVAAVDVTSMDRRSVPQQATSAKESWRFARNGGTNTLIRTRFTPMAGREVIESTNLFGGRLLVAHSTNALPADFSMPGFEACNLLSELLAAGPDAEGKESGSFILVATLPAGVTLKAWFDHRRVMPTRIEKRQGDALVFVFSRTEAGIDDRVLPLRDSLNFYERGRIAMTVLRSFSKVEELPPHRPTAPPTN